SGVASVALSVLGPRILGHATDLIFAGVVGRRFPSGMSKAAVVEQLRRSGQGNLANLLSGVNFTPGQGIDFTQVGQVLLLVLAIYVVAALFGYPQGWLSTTVVQRSLFRLRAQAEAKLARLPLSYFDRQPRGEVLSRVTNDMDNLAQSLQQALSQVITSLLTIVGVLAIMIVISPLLALIALLTVPLAVVVAAAVGKRDKGQEGDRKSTRLNSSHQIISY